MALITGSIKNPDGSPYIGSARFALNDLGVGVNTLYLPTVVSVESNGTVTVDLWPNTKSLTATYYKCSLDNGTVFNISIPGDNPSYDLGEVIVIDPGTLEPGILQRVMAIINSALASVKTRIGDIEGYTGIADDRVPSTAITGEYPDMVAGTAQKVDKTLTAGDGLTGGPYRGDVDVTVSVDNTVIRATDTRLADAREWVAPTAPLEVVSQPSNNTRYAWTPQRIWNSILAWFSTINSDNLPEGSNNLYYTDSRVANNPAVQDNTSKVSATGSVTTHSDIISAGSGQIISTQERNKLGKIEDDAQVNTVISVSGKTGEVVLDSTDVGLGSVPNIDTSNANNIISGTLSGSRLGYGNTAGTPAQGNDPRFTNAREWTASTVSTAEAQAGASNSRRAWTSERVRENVAFYTQPFTPAEKSKLSGLDSANYLPVGGTAVNSHLFDSLDSGQFLRSDTADTMAGDLSVSGTVLANYFNTAPNTVDSGVTQVCVETGNDGYIRHGTPNSILGFIGATSASTPNTPVMRDGLGDIKARLFRSEFDHKNSDIGFIMTQVNTDVNNYLRPSTPGQLANTLATYLTRSDSVNNNGPVVIRVDDADFSVEDSTDATRAYIWRNHSSSKLYLGTSDAVPTTRADMFTEAGDVYWHAGNDGLGSGLDADLWDGWQRDAYLNQAVRTDSNVSFSGLSFGASSKQHVNLGSIQYGLGVQTLTSYWRSSDNFALFRGGEHSDASLAAGPGGTRVFDYRGDVNQFNFNSPVNFNANILTVAGLFPTIHLKDESGKSFWLQNQSNSIIFASKILHNGVHDGSIAKWDDNSQTAYFWDKQVAVHGTTPGFTGVDIYNDTKRFREFVKSDNYLYFNQYAESNQAFEGHIIRFGTTEVRHYVPLVNGSSRHIKDIQGPIPDGLDMINRLNPVVYNYKNNPDNTEVGLIAEEVPRESHLVYGSGPDLAIDYTKLPVYLVDAIKKLTERIEALEGTVKNSNG